MALSHPPCEPAAPDAHAAAAHLDMHFQPIAAVRRGALLGVEALARARRADGTGVPPLALFAEAQRAGTTTDLDRACRQLAVARFAPIHAARPSLVCFVNCHVSTFLADVDGPHGWPALAAAAGVDPRAIAIEVLETQAADLDALAAATAAYRAAGFLVVVDDVRTGHSNLDRIAAVHPDLIKADRSLAHGCADDRMRRAVLRALVALTEDLGGWLVVEGVERAEDAITALDIGADLLQGYYLARPAPLPDADALREPTQQAVQLAARFRSVTRERVHGARLGRERRATNVRPPRPSWTTPGAS